MREFDLNIEKILENWEVSHAVREIIANAIDEQILTATKDIEIVKINQDWHIIDYGRGLNYHHLTQNENEEKLKNDRLIGRFGVGLKDALATLYRNNVKVTISSKYGLITLKQSAKTGFEDIITLHAEIREPVDPNMNGTDFCLSGCSDNDIEVAKSLFVKFSKCNVLEKTPVGQVIENMAENANIYINGVKVAEEPNFLFSYNITSLNAALKKALNRERTNVGRTAYTDRIKSILLSCETEKVIKPLVEDLQQLGSGNKHDELSWNDVSLYVSRKMSEITDKATFVTIKDLEERPSLIDEMKREGYTPIIVSTAVVNKMEDFNEEADEGKKLTTASQYLQKQEESFDPKIVDVSDLTEQERKVYDRMNDVLALIGGKPKRVAEIKIAETLYNSDMRNNAVGLWDSSKRRILVKRSQLQKIELFAGTLLHECAHANSCADDVSRNFEYELTSYLGKVSAKALD